MINGGDLQLPAKAVEASIGPNVTAAQRENENGEAANAKLIAESGLFDAAWYSTKHPTIEESGLPPALHYIRIGGAEGWAPSPEFDAASYLSRYEDVRQSGINPLIHYILFGQAESREVRPADPEEVIRRLVIRSGLFDEEWYRASYPEVLKSKQSPLDQFIEHGRKKGQHPGPGFDSNAYIATYADVASSQINPLVHYLQFGRTEGRIITPVAPLPEVAPDPPLPSASDITLLEGSPFFNKDWYLSRDPEIQKQGLSAAQHYLQHGAAEMRPPSIYFDPKYYVIEQSPEIKQTGINPLLHFLKVGKALGRKPRALFEAISPAEPIKPMSPTSWPIIAPDLAPANDMADWRLQADLQNNPAEGTLFLGRTAIAWWQNGEAFRRSQDRLAAFAGLSGLDQTRDFRVLRSGTYETAPLAKFEPLGYRNVGPALAEGTAKLTDLWFANDRTLRLRLGEDGPGKQKACVVRAFQCDLTHSPDPVLAGEALLGETGPGFVDFPLINPFLPMLIVVAETDGQALELGLLPFPSLCRGGLHYAELVGSAQLSNPMDQLRLLSDFFVRDLMLAVGLDQPRLISDIAVELSGASGAEAIFSPAFHNWIGQVFGIAIKAAGSSAADTRGEAYLRLRLTSAAPVSSPQAAARVESQYTLELPPDAVPSIAALAARGLDGSLGHILRVGPYFVADGVTARPRLSVQLPQMGEDLIALQPSWSPINFPLLRPKPGPGTAEGGAALGTDLMHLAIRFPGNTEESGAAMLMPLAPDARGDILPKRGNTGVPYTRVDAIVRASDPVRLETFLGSLVRQQGMTLGEVTAEAITGRADPQQLQAVLDRQVPGRGRVIMRRGYPALGPSTLVHGSSSAFSIIADDAVVLHDARTVETLLTLVRGGKVASASCVIIRETMVRNTSKMTFESGGYFPSHLSLLSSPHLILALPDTRGAFQIATYPVAANDPGFMMVNNEAVRAHGAMTDDLSTHAADAIEFSVQALAAGYRHLCTSAVRAISLNAVPRREISDPPGIGCFDPLRWEDVIRSVTIIRELH